MDTSQTSFVHKYLSPGSYMTPAEIKPGMTGYGLTVFQGATIEKFEITVIGILKKVMSGRDAILVRMSGPEMQKNNVIRGMSGSPCYINGKLIGAISFGYDFSKEPIAGVTPIVDMLDSLADSNLTKTPIAKSGPIGFNVSPAESGLATVTSGDLKMSPLVSPVALAGYSQNAEKFLGKEFKDMGLLVSSGSSGGLDSRSLNAAAAGQIKPGSACSVLLTSGDFTAVATGTVTARFGNKVLAFGHPFLSAGAVEFPMATATVHKVLPSLSVSFKLASPVSEVGSFTADRPWSCAGQVGKQAQMIPCSFDIVDETRQINRTFNAQIIDHPDLTPQLLAATTMSAVDATHQYAGPYVAKVESRLEADGIEPLERVDRFASNIAPHSILEMLMGFMMGNSIASSVYRSASSITSNEFQKASIKSFKIKVTLEDGHQTATIDRVYVEKPFAAPGEQVKVLCILRPYNQEPKIETLSFKVPRAAPDGNLVIGVAGGDQIDYVRHRMGLSDPEPESLKQIVDELRRQGRGDAINLVVGLPEQTLLLNGVKVPDPPSHWSKVLFSNRHTRGPQIVKGELRASKQSDWLLYGSHILTVEVRSPDKAAAKTAPSAMPNYLGGDDPAMTELARKTLGSSAIGRSSGRSNAPVTVIQGGFTGSAIVVEAGGPQARSTTAKKSTDAGGSIFSSAGKLYPHMRLHRIWRQETEEDFHYGKPEGTTIDSWGRVGPGLDQLSSISMAPDLTIWSGTWSQGYFYFAADNKIYRWKADEKKPEKVAELETSMIPSLAADSQGTLYAAAVPGKGVYAISPGAKAKQVFKPQEQVVTTLCCDDKDNLYVGTAGNGKVYKLDKSGASSLLFDTGQAHVTALFYSARRGRLYIGTAEKGSVYRIDSDGKPSSVYQTPDHIVTGMAETKNGDLYVSTANQGKLVRVLASGEAQSLASSEAFYTLLYDPEKDAVFSGDAEGDITMAAIDKVTEQPYFIPVCHTDQEAVLALASNGRQLFAGSSNISLVKAFNLAAAKAPYYDSRVMDAGILANWVRLRSSGPFTESDQKIADYVKVETRTGNTSMADPTWSSWSESSFDGESYVLNSPPGRYLQYRLSWTNTAGGGNFKHEGPQIGRVDVVYLPKDQAPQFSTISLKAASSLSGKQNVSVTGVDADGDNMLCTIEISSDSGKTWQKLARDLRQKNAKKEAPEAKAADKETDENKTAKKGDKRSEKKSGKSGKADKAESKDKDSKSKSGTSSNADKEGDSTNKEADKTEKSEKSEKSDDSNKDNSQKEKSERSEAEKKDNDKSENGKTQSFHISRLKNLGISLSRLREREVPLDEFDSEDKKDGDSKDSGADKPKDNAPDRNEKEDKEDEDEDKKDEKDEKKDDKKKSSKTKSARGASGSSSQSSGSGKNSEGSSTETFAYNWDTAKQKDGHYILRFVLDDRLSNPEDHQKTINVRAVTVDNKAPEIGLIECSRTTKNRVECKVTVKDNLSPIVNAMYRFDDGDFYAFASQGKTSDALSTSLVASHVYCPSGAKKIEVKISDRAGNTASKSASIK